MVITLSLLSLMSCQPAKDNCVTDEDALFLEMQACLGLSAPKPTIEYTDFNERGIGAVWGVYMPVHETILINTGDMGPGFEHSCRTTNETLKHEYIHHILHMNGLGDDSRSHASWAFVCQPGVNTYN